MAPYSREPDDGRVGSEAGSHVAVKVCDWPGCNVTIWPTGAMSAAGMMISSSGPPDSSKTSPAFRIVTGRLSVLVSVAVNVSS